MTMRFLVVEDTADKATVEQAIRTLVVMRKQAVIPSTAAEIGADVDELLERLFGMQEVG